MMSKIVGDEPCELCRAEGGDRTGNHAMIFEDGGRFCKRHGYLGGGDKDHNPTEVIDNMTEFNEVKTLPVTALKDRGIDKDVAEHYGIHTEFNTTTGKPSAYYYPFTVDGKVVAYKKRILPKTFVSVGESMKGKPVQFIGQTACTGPGKKLLITEGQDDMLAAFQMLWRQYPKFKPHVVSLPNGANTKAISDNAAFLNNYEEVLFCPDQDEAGQKVAKEIALLLPEVKLMTISEKDPNDMLLKGKGKEFVNAFFRAAPYAPEGFVTVDDVFEEATRMPEWGKPWPWPSLTKLTYGRRLGEGVYFGAGVKIGKSEAVNQLAQHVIVNEGNKIALFKLEEKPSMTVRRIAGKVMHKQFHIPDGDFTQEELIEGVNSIRDKVVLYDRYGSTSWDELKAAIRHAVVVEGVQDIVIDPLTRLTTGMTASEANTELERIADEISILAKDLGFTYYVFCHLKAPQNGKPHEEGGRVHSNQFTGSRAMMRAAYYFIGIERDKSPDLPKEQRNMSTFVLLEDRAFGNSGRFEVYYDDRNGDYLEPKQEFE